MKKFITTKPSQTKKLGELLAKELRSARLHRSAKHRGQGKIICLSGELGSGKTTFTQGLLKGFKIKGRHTSPTFVIMKKYGKNIYHFDAYRVNAKDILSLGWKEIINDKNNIIIIEWADRIKKIISQTSLWIEFRWIDKNKRVIEIL